MAQLHSDKIHIKWDSPEIIVYKKPQIHMFQSIY